MIKLSCNKMKFCCFDRGMIIVTGEPWTVMTRNAISNSNALSIKKCHLAFLGNFITSGKKKKRLSSEQMMTGQCSKHQFHYLFILEIGPTSTCLTPYFSVSLSHKRSTIIQKLTSFTLGNTSQTTSLTLKCLFEKKKFSVSLYHQHGTIVQKLTFHLEKHLSNNKLNPQMVWSQESNPGCIGIGQALLK